MRKIKFLLFSVLLAGAAFTSCSPDELLDADKPVVTVERDGASVTTINDKSAGDMVPVVVRFKMGAQESRLEKIKISIQMQNQTFVVRDTVLNQGIFNRGDKFVEFTYNIAVGQSLSTITFQTWDTKGRVGANTISVAPKGTYVPDYNVERVVLLSGQCNLKAGYSCFYSVSTNKVIKLADAAINSQFIDFVYYFGLKNAATITSISDPLLANKVDGPAGIRDVMSQFNVLNKTQIARAAVADWDANSISGVTADKFSEKTGQTNLAVGSYLAFKTILGYNGLIKVYSIDGDTQETRSITLDVKIVK